MSAIDKKATLAELLTGDQIDRIAWSCVGILTQAGVPAIPQGPRPKFDITERAFQIDPYPDYARLRRDDPVHHSSLPEGWFVFRYEDVIRVCDERENFSGTEIGSDEPRGMFKMDGQAHDSVLEKVKQAWDQGAAQVKTYVQRSITRALTEIRNHPHPGFDLVDDFARPVPRDIYFDIVGGEGIAPEKRLELDGLARTVMKHQDPTKSMDDRKAGKEAAEKLASQLMEMMLGAEANPGFAGSFLANIAPLVDEAGTGPFTPEVAACTLVNLTVAGYMSVEFLLATGIRRLLLDDAVGSSRVDLQACKLEYSIVSPK